MSEDDGPKMSFFDDDDDDYDEWLYVEDDFPLEVGAHILKRWPTIAVRLTSSRAQDELAETSIPDPGYAGTNSEIEGLLYDFDLYDYWVDVDYGEDVFWDHDVGSHAGKRRHLRSDVQSSRKKRPKLDLRETGGGNVHFVSVKERMERSRSNARPPLERIPKSFALLPDWKTRHEYRVDASTTPAMSDAMRNAAKSHDMDKEAHPSNMLSSMVSDVDEEEAEEDDGEEADDLPVDLDVLKNVLKQRLEDAGLDGMEESEFMATLSKMLQGDGDTDDMAGDLADRLLSQAGQGESNPLSSWLSQQGVSLAQEDARAGDEDASSIAMTEMSEDPRRSIRTPQTSRSDSAIDVARSGTGVQTCSVAGQSSIDSVSPKPKARKRRAVDEDHDGSRPNKEARRTANK